MNEPRCQLPTACEAFDDHLDRVLDGDEPAADLMAHPHYGICESCRESVAAAHRLIAGLRAMPNIEPSARFADEVTRAAVRDFRRRRQQRVVARVGGFAVAAAVLVGVWAVWPSATVEPAPVAVTLPPGGVRQPFADAGNAAAKLTGKVADDVMAPARNLFASLDRPKVATPILTLSETPNIEQATKAGLTPLANTTRRAFNLFVRDVGGAAGKVKS